MQIITCIKKHLYTIITAFIAAVGAGIFWSYHKGKIRSLESEKFIERAHREVAKIEEQIVSLEEEKQDNKRVIEALHELRRERQAETLNKLQDIHDMKDEEIERAFRDLF